MTEENDLTTEAELETEETPKEGTLIDAVAPIAMFVAGAVGAVYLTRKVMDRFESRKETEVHVEAIEATSQEA